MTTIATDGKVLAADRQVSDGSLICSPATKIARLANGAVVGVAGGAFNLMAFLEWFNGGRKETLQLHSDDFEALVLTAAGQVVCYDRHGRTLIQAPPVAIGTGAQIAIGAMEAGATAQEAVEIACRRDAWTSGPVDTLTPE